MNTNLYMQSLQVGEIPGQNRTSDLEHHLVETGPPQADAVGLDQVIVDPLEYASVWQNLNPGPQLQLPFRWTVPDTAPAITLAVNGDIGGLKSLFERGLASPRDTSASRGYSLIRVGPAIVFFSRAYTRLESS
jgi:hypothetical protein